ncbi:uncharacterized protein [Cicer arietinum]|uniref:uncharacterized protein n=1 Tax=Cicer arietinum TaxID=3827 RepID=UPI003CC6123F
MADTSKTEYQMTLKLLVNQKTNKVLFAETGKEFVDILCSFLTLPLGTIARLLQKDTNMGSDTIGCLNSLYQSVQNLDEKCLLMTERTKKLLLQPKNSSEKYCSTLKLNIDDTEPTNYFLCSKPGGCWFNCSISTSPDEVCACGSDLDNVILLKHFRNGFVNGDASFVITDNLRVIPNCMDNASLALLQDLGVQSASLVKEINVNLTKDKVLDLLKCSLVSKSPLTHLFLEKKSPIERPRIFCCDFENGSNIQINVKLVIRKSDCKILFALGEKDFADLLLSFLTFPLGGVAHTLQGNCSMGSIDILYKSIADLDVDKYFTSKDAKNKVVEPRVLSEFKLHNLLIPIDKPCVQYYRYQQSYLHNSFVITDELRSDLGKYTVLKHYL